MYRNSVEQYLGMVQVTYSRVHATKFTDKLVATYFKSVPGTSNKKFYKHFYILKIGQANHLSGNFWLQEHSINVVSCVLLFSMLLALHET